ncbi:leucine-rich repeat-containing protein 15-like [Drosophila kikkawai]|uniref:Leucine-rich repeat-containing protein 15-like n=1 Tax=Drosophila kikkawai TaxID=30033 RepID=A0A6P4I4K7_DROKI|nr:protein artichoke-like [Drosophila kikkawai]
MFIVRLLLSLLLGAVSALEANYFQDVCPESYCSLPEMKTEYAANQAPNIMELHLGYCRELEVLRCTPNLRILSLSNCLGDPFAKEDIQLTYKLNMLHLRRSNISELHENQFSVMYRLEILELGGNSIERLANGTFRELTRLEMLGLQGNLIKSLPEDVFHPLENLRSLDLSDNKISNITRDVFARNLNLQTLLLRGNPLTQLVFPTPGAQSLFQLLDLSRCRQLKELVLHSHVDTLILEESGVESLQVTANKSLLRLQAANSKLSHLSLGDPISLIELDLRGTLLVWRNISKVFCNSRSLQRLDLSQNSIESLPLSYNNVSRDLCLLPSLRFLNLSSNQLVSLQLESSFFGPRLAVLDLSHNKLESFSPEALDGAHDLRSLFLENNNLTTFNYRSLYEKHNNLKTVALFGNKFSSEFYNEMIEYFHFKDVNLIEKDFPRKSEAKQHEWSVYDILIVIFLLGVLAYARMYLYKRGGANCCFGCKWGQRTEDNSESRVRFLFRPESET